MPAPIISTSGLTKRFADLTAVEGLDLSVAPGEIFGLVGPDGAGKSTTLRMLCGLLAPSSGTAQVAGCDPFTQPEALSDRIGYMAQRFGLYRDLTVDENMRFFADLFSISDAELQELSARLLAMTRLSPFRMRQAGHLSGGMKQKLSLLCALLHKPRLLFLDEPTTGVDPVSRRDFWKILYQLTAEGITVFIATAYLDEAERCNRIGLMHQGRLIECDTPENLKKGMPGRGYRIEGQGLRSVRRALLEAEGVLSAEHSGGSLRLFLSPSRTSPDRLEEQLRQAELGPIRFTPIEPDIEDVFTSRIQQSAGRALGGLQN